MTPPVVTPGPVSGRHGGCPRTDVAEVLRDRRPSPTGVLYPPVVIDPSGPRGTRCSLYDHPSRSGLCSVFRVKLLHCLPVQGLCDPPRVGSRLFLRCCRSFYLMFLDHVLCLRRVCLQGSGSQKSERRKIFTKKKKKTLSERRSTSTASSRVLFGKGFHRGPRDWPDDPSRRKMKKRKTNFFPLLIRGLLGRRR